MNKTNMSAFMELICDNPNNLYILSNQTVYSEDESNSIIRLLEKNDLYELLMVFILTGDGNDAICETRAKWDSEVLRYYLQNHDIKEISEFLITTYKKEMTQ